MLIEDYCYIWWDIIIWESVSNEYYIVENNNKIK